MSRKKTDGLNSLDQHPTSEDTDWFAKLRSEPIDPQMDEAFRHWLAESPEHEIEYEHCELIGELSGDLQDDPELAGYIADCEKLIDAGQQKKQPEKTFGLFKTGTIPVALAASVLVFAFAMLLVLQIPPQDNYVTAVGEQRVIALDDGSNIVLNTDTELSVSYTERQRAVHLHRGEALFTVTKDPDRPFTVHAASGIAKAVGTRFSVQLKDSGITVSVLEGLVDVSPDGDSNRTGEKDKTRLKEGQAVNYYDGVLAPVSPANVARIEAWRAGRLNFDSARLMDVIAEHNRYTKTKIIIADDSIKDLLISGIFRIGENEPLLFALENSFNLRSVDRGEVIMLLAESRLKTAPHP